MAKSMFHLELHKNSLYNVLSINPPVQRKKKKRRTTVEKMLLKELFKCSPSTYCRRFLQGTLSNFGNRFHKQNGMLAFQDNSFPDSSGNPWQTLRL